MRKNQSKILAGGRCPPDPPILAGVGKPPQTLPLNSRSSHLIEAAKRGRLDQMIFFFGAADDTRAADDRPAERLAGRPAERPTEAPTLFPGTHKHRHSFRTL